MATNKTAGDKRKEYSGVELSLESAAKDPFDQFRKWYKEAGEVEEQEINAMSVSTVSPDGTPSSRIVLLKSFDVAGFTFYTNYASQKGVDLSENDKSCLLFWWPRLARQIRITGQIAKTSDEDSSEYFASRPRGSQIGAAASPQSKPVDSRNDLLERVREIEEEFEGKAVPRPEQWGGYVLRPQRFEFWQGQENRLHDRICYVSTGSEGWTQVQLAP